MMKFSTDTSTFDIPCSIFDIHQRVQGKMVLPQNHSAVLVAGRIWNGVSGIVFSRRMSAGYAFLQ